MSSFAPLQQKLGTLTGELVRIRRLTDCDSATLEQFRILLDEISLLGYDSEQLLSTITARLTKTGDPFWAKAYAYITSLADEDSSVAE